MGYMKHHAIVVTAYKTSIEKAYAKAKATFNTLCSPIVEGIVNGYASFFIAPDGSKEGWYESNLYDTKREEFIDWMMQQRYEDGSNCIDFVELRYGGDDDKADIIRHN